MGLFEKLNLCQKTREKQVEDLKTIIREEIQLIHRTTVNKIEKISASLPKRRLFLYQKFRQVYT